MKPKKKQPKVEGKMIRPAGVEHDLTDKELSDFIVFSREMTIKQLEIRHWQGEIQRLKDSVNERLKVSTPKHIVDWSHIFNNGKIYILKNKAPKVKIGQEEKRPSEQKLQKEQGKRNEG